MTRIATRGVSGRGAVSLFRAVVVAGLVMGLGACAGDSPCATGTGKPMAVFTLYFGEAIAGRGDLTEKEWQSFLEDTIVASLPDGFTVLDGNGAWMNPATRRTVREATKVLVTALPRSPESLAAINHVRSAYQTRFHQQLVGMTVEQACGTF
jgi:hypothetical protein